MSDSDNSGFDIHSGENTEEKALVRIQPSIHSELLKSITADKHSKSQYISPTKQAKFSTNAKLAHPSPNKLVLSLNDSTSNTKKLLAKNAVATRLINYQSRVAEKVSILTKEKSNDSMQKYSFQSAKSAKKTTGLDSKLKKLKSLSDHLFKTSQSKTVTNPAPSKPTISTKRSAQPSNTSLINKSTQSLTKTNKKSAEKTNAEIARSINTNSPQSFSNQSSDSALVKKFEHEYYTIANEFDTDDLINYSRFCQILLRMGFIGSSVNKSEIEKELILRIWKRLRGNEVNKIKKKDLCEFMLAVVNLNKSRGSLNESSGFDRKNRGSLSAEEVSRIHHEYYKLFSNRRSRLTVSFQRISSIIRKASPNQSGSIDYSRINSSPILNPLKSPIYSPQLLNAVTTNRVLKLSQIPHKDSGLIQSKSLPDKKRIPCPAPKMPKINLSLLSCERKHLSIDSQKSNLKDQSETQSVSTNTRTPTKNTKQRAHKSRAATTKTLNNDFEFFEHPRPTLSIPKIAHSKSTSLKSPTESMLKYLELTENSISPLLNTKSISYMQKKGLNGANKSYMKRKNEVNSWNKLKKLEKGNMTERIRCKSPESYEESEESILVTVVLPDDTEQFLRIHRDDELDKVLRGFAIKNSLESEQVSGLKQEIIEKLKDL